MNTVLIIEDNEAIRDNTAELLVVNHYQVLTAENGQAGFNLAKSQSPDVILCDMMMPESDGEKFLSLAKADSSLQHIPIIVFSAGTVSPFVQKKLINASNGSLKKPFLEEDLLRSIENVLNK